MHAQNASVDFINANIYNEFKYHVDKSKMIKSIKKKKRANIYIIHKNEGYYYVNRY